MVYKNSKENDMIENTNDVHNTTTQQSGSVVLPTGTVLVVNKNEKLNETDVKAVEIREEFARNESSGPKTEHTSRTDKKPIIETSRLIEAQLQLPIVTKDLTDREQRILCGEVHSEETARIGNKYAVEYLPMPTTVSPFKELNVSELEASILYGTANDIKRENAVISYFNLPKGIKNPETLQYGDATGICSHNHIPMLTILRKQLDGLPTEQEEFPVVASPHPACTASYVHNVMTRICNDALDMRYRMVASDNDKPAEEYLLGRVWTPLSYANIHFVYDGQNYDAVDPNLESAFDLLKKPQLISTKDMSNFNVIFRFAENMDPNMSNILYMGLKALTNVKLSLSRLYWRIWCAIFEAQYWEERGIEWVVNRISHLITPVEISNATTCGHIIRQAGTNVQPFMVSPQMIDGLGGNEIIQYMYFLLSEGFQSDLLFGLNTTWPELGRIVMVYMAQPDRIFTVNANMTVRSVQLFSILHWFARITGQIQLIEEIGRTVASFLYRPEGDSTFMGHQSITMALPMFRCSKTMLLLWPVELMELAYEPRTPPLYKTIWVGAIHYMMMSLSCNAVLAELGIFSMLQMILNGIVAPSSWIQTINNLFTVSRHGCRLIRYAQRATLRFGWGQVFNKITGSIIINAVHTPHLLRCIQWQEWFVFSRMTIEGSWLASMMSHITPKSALVIRKSYRPASAITQGLQSEVYYRLETMAGADLRIHTYNLANAPKMINNIHAVAAISGLPLDGQFMPLRFSERTWMNYSFVLRNASDSFNILHTWSKRQNWTWEIVSTATYNKVDQANYIEEIPLGASLFPVPDNIIFNEEEDNAAGIYSDTIVEQVARNTIIYGHPDLFPMPVSHKQATPVEEVQSHMTKPYCINQELHYCQTKRAPTQCETLLSRRHTPEVRFGGVNPKSLQQIVQSASVSRTTCPLFIHRSPQRQIEEHGASIHMPNTALSSPLPKPKRDSRNNEYYEISPDTDFYPAPNLGDAAPIMARQLQLDAAKAVRNVKPTQNPKPVCPIASRFDDMIQDLLSRFTDVDNLEKMLKDDRVLSRFRGIALMSHNTAGADADKARAMRQLLEELELLDYILYFSKYHLEVRANVARIIAELLGSASRYVAAGSGGAHKLNRLVTDFSRMSVTLSSFPQLTQDEWAEITPVVTAEGMLTLRLANDNDEALLSVLGCTDEKYYLDILEKAESTIKNNSTDLIVQVIKDDVATTSMQGFQIGGGEPSICSQLGQQFVSPPVAEHDLVEEFEVPKAVADSTSLTKSKSSKKVQKTGSRVLSPQLQKTSKKSKSQKQSEMANLPNTDVVEADFARMS